MTVAHKVVGDAHTVATLELGGRAAGGGGRAVDLVRVVGAVEQPVAALVVGDTLATVHALELVVSTHIQHCTNRQ